MSSKEESIRIYTSTEGHVARRNLTNLNEQKIMFNRVPDAPNGVWMELVDFQQDAEGVATFGVQDGDTAVAVRFGTVEKIS